MKSASEIKQHLAGIKQTRQITNAMYLLSVSRLKKSITGMDYTKSYLKTLRSTMDDILLVTKGAEIHNRFLEKDTSGTALILSVMGDKRLCGDYNHAVAKLTKEKTTDKDGSMIYCFGMVGEEILTSDGIKPDKVLPGSSMHPSLRLAGDLAKELIDMYTTDKVNEVYVIYTPYSGGERKPVSFRLLPLLRHDFTDIDDGIYPHEILYEPSAEEVLESFVPKYCSGIIFNILSQSAASENAARMEAMQSAASNADDMIKELEAELKAVRQVSITNELTEIMASQG